MGTLRQLAGSFLGNLWHLTKWLARHSWDWGSVLFVVAGLWGWGYFVVSLEIAAVPPSVIEFTGGCLLLFLGTFVLFARIIHAAWASNELPSIFQRIIVTIFVVALLGALSVGGYRYLFDKIPELALDKNSLLPPKPPPPPEAETLGGPLPHGPKLDTILLKNIAFSGSFHTGGNVTTTYTVGTKSATDFDVNIYSYCAFGYTFPDDMSKQREAARNFWEKAEESKDFSQGLIRSSMTSNVNVSSLPLPESFIGPLNNGEMAAYYFLKIKDAKTNRVLLDICTFDNAKITDGECDELARPHPQ